MNELEEIDIEEEKLDLGLAEPPEKPPNVATTLPASGPELVPHLTPGTRVVRGPDWKWGDQVITL